MALGISRLGWQLFTNSQSENKEALWTLKGSHRMGDRPIFLKTSALMTIYRRNLEETYFQPYPSHWTVPLRKNLLLLQELCKEVIMVGKLYVMRTMWGKMYSNQVRYFFNKNNIIIYKFFESKFNFIVYKHAKVYTHTFVFLSRKPCFSCDIIISTKRWQTLKALSVRN
jgi:hypothetical protein